MRKKSNKITDELDDQTLSDLDECFRAEEDFDLDEDEEFEMEKEIIKESPKNLTSVKSKKQF